MVMALGKYISLRDVNIIARVVLIQKRENLGLEKNMTLIIYVMN
jgi:hypothetical protein